MFKNISINGLLLNSICILRFNGIFHSFLRQAREKKKNFEKERTKKRTDGSTGPKEEALAYDISDALKKPDAAGATPAVAVEPIGLNRIPICTPAETDSISMCQKLVAMETRLKSFEETLGDYVIHTIAIQDEANNMTTYANAGRLRGLAVACRTTDH